MGNPRRWYVVLYTDEVNSLHGLVYVLNRVLGVSPDAGLLMATMAGSDRHAVATVRDHARAEALVAELQVYGVQAAVREV